MAKKLVTNEELTEEPALVSCLRNEKIKVRFILKPDGFIKNPDHPLYGGLAEGAVRKFCVPLQKNGKFVQVLTDAEKEYLEEVMGMEKNALSVYKKEDNYWKNRYVELTKEDNYLDLSDPIDYIKYKILLSPRQIPVICKSEMEYRRSPLPTYQFVITTDKEDISLDAADLRGKAKAFNLYSKIADNYEKLSYLLLKVAGKTIRKSDTNLIESAINTAILTKTEKFIKECENPYLDTEILILKAVDKGFVERYKDEYTLKDGRVLLCPLDLVPSLTTACQFLNAPKNQEYLLALQAQVE